MNNDISLLRVKDVAKKLGMSVPTIWRKTKNDPNFPKPIKVSASITAWKVSEINAWVEGL